MNLKLFVEKINDSLPTSIEFKNKFGSEAQYVSFRNQLALYFDRSAENMEINNPYELITHTNVSQSTLISGFEFKKEGFIENGYSFFCTYNDSELLALDRNGRVVSGFSEYDEMIRMSPTFDLFLRVLITYCEYNKRMVFHSGTKIRKFESRLKEYAFEGFSKRWLENLFLPLSSSIVWNEI